MQGNGPGKGIGAKRKRFEASQAGYLGTQLAGDLVAVKVQISDIAVAAVALNTYPGRTWR